jgi:hypothetical protein
VARSLDGIISYLTVKHGGNVHEKGIVTVTAPAAWRDSVLWHVRHVVDLRSEESFCSQNRPAQWLCWDFGNGVLVRIAHYTIVGWYLRSWVVQGSLDGERWTLMDRRTDDGNYNNPHSRNIASFGTENALDCRFIRLVLTDLNHANEWGENILWLAAVEFFGAISE